MKCTKCGKNNDDSFRFCQYCGAPTAHNSVEMLSAIDTPDSLPKSEMSTPSPSMVEAWFNQDSSDPRSTQNGTHKNNESAASLDLPLSSIAEDDGMTDDLSKLIALAPKAEHKPAPGERICLSCGAIVAKDHHFCGNCGAKYNSEFNLPPLTNDLSALASEANSSKRLVERVSFVNEFAVPGNTEPACFSLFHVNDDGSLGDQIILNEGENIIGKTSTPNLNNDKYVSPKHLRIVCHKDKAIVEDNGSLNGVFIKLSGGSTELQDGDSFRIGEELLSYSHGKSKQQLLSSKHDDTELLGGDEPECWGYIRLILGPFLEGNVYRLYDKEVSLGRTHADILFPKDGFVSGLHAKLTPNHETATLTDLNSSNGTFVKIRNPVTVQDIQYILIGNQLLRLKLQKC